MVACQLAAQVWPPTIPCPPLPQPLLHMLPAASYQDFCVAPSGAASWHWMGQGRRVIALAPPTPHNLATYGAWRRGGASSQSATQAAAGGGGAGSSYPSGAIFLGSLLKGVVKTQMVAGDVLFIPGVEGGGVWPAAGCEHFSGGEGAEETLPVI